MKKALVSAILGLAAVASVQAQGVVILYNYNQPATLITYGALSGGPLGTGLVQGVGGNWTVGIYAVAGSTAAAVNGALAGDGGYGSLAGVGGLVLNPTTTGLLAGYPGLFGPPANATVSFAGAGTFVVVAYNGANYESSLVRGHSAAFEMNAAVNPSTPSAVGTAMSSFAVVGVPEPSTFALAGLGLAGLLIFRRRK